MIRRLRRRHLRVILVLAIVLPILLVGSWLARPSAPVQRIPPELLRP